MPMNIFRNDVAVGIGIRNANDSTAPAAWRCSWRCARLQSRLLPTWNLSKQYVMNQCRAADRPTHIERRFYVRDQ